MITLNNYETGETIRAATIAEYEASRAAAETDGGAGVIVVDGVSCFVDGEVTPPKLPRQLHAAYDWTAAAGELGELRNLAGQSLAAYCRDSAKNCTDNGDGDVSESDLVDLHDWLMQGGR